MAQHLDGQVKPFRPLDAGPYTFVRCDALTIKVREGGRTVNVHALIRGQRRRRREVLGLDVASEEEGAGWPASCARFPPAAWPE